MKYLIFFIILTASSNTFAAKIESLLNNMDRLFKADTSIAEMEMSITTPHWQRTLKMKAWSKGLEHSFITIQEPKKDKGISTLKIENKMWNYFPKINKVIKVPPSMMMGSWMGSDFTNDDLVKENTYREDNTFKFGKGNEKQYQIILKPKPKTVTVWGRIELWIDKKTELPAKEEFFDEKGEKIRIIYFKEVKQFSGKKIPSVMELIPLKKKGNKTIVRYINMKFNIPIKDSVFTRKNLQKRR